MEDDTDWDAEYADMLKKVEAQKDQSVDLPEVGSYTLYQTHTPLTIDGKFEEWHRSIMDNMRSHKLQNLVESGVKRPNKEDPGAETWYQLSQWTKYWLTVNMSSDVVNRVEARGIGTVFADKFMEYLRNDFRGEGPARISTIYLTIRDMRKTAYPTSEAFITDL